MAEIGFASQKNYISFYVAKHGVMLQNKDLFAGFNHGKGCVRYSNARKIDFRIIEKILSDTFQSDEKPC